MKRELTYSVALHLAVVAATVISSPFSGKPKHDLGDVIHVSMISAPPQAQVTPIPPTPIAPPKAVTAPTKAVPVPNAKSLPSKKPAPAKTKKPEKKTAYQEPAETAAEDVQGTANGLSEIKEASGSPFAGSATDNADFQYPYWFTQAFQKLGSNFSSPVEVQGKLVCVVFFQVIASGKVIHVEVTQGSGIQAFDNACIAAVYRSAPFPPLPRDFSAEIIGITVPFKFGS